MKIAYFDCFSGIAGDMALSALVNAGADFEYLKAELLKLPLKHYSIECCNKIVSGIMASKITVKWEEKQQSHRHLSHIYQIIDESHLRDSVKEKSKAVFLKLATAEAKIHGTSVEKVHFHEVGAVDSIIDIVGTVLALDSLEVKDVFVSPLPFTRGFINCQHGVIPSPAPATLELLKGFTLYNQESIKTELITPTGAALLASFAKESFSGFSSIEGIGYGAGTKTLPIPNLLRVIIGTSISSATKDNNCRSEEHVTFLEDEVISIETNIDDMNPEFIAHLFDRLLAEGALDVTTTPITMKRSRPAYKISVLAEEKKLDKIALLLFEETTTFGIRYHKERRKVLNREVVTVETPFGPVRIKLGIANTKIVQVAPEYLDCERAAKAYNVPLKEVYETAKFLYRNSIK